MNTTWGVWASAVGFIFLCALGSFVEAKGIKHYHFALHESNFTRLCSTKSMLTVNRSFPGPVLKVEEGDTLFVNVRNHGDYNVTIHWHGVKQPRNPWGDGPAYVTQCPIQPKSNFTYEIDFSDEVGTLWWHAHSDWTRATVHGAIVISPRNGTSYPFRKPDAEQVIVLASWYKGDVMAVIEEALASGGEPNVSDAYTINGQPGDLYDCSNTTAFRMAVEFGKTYLLRIVNAVLNEEMFFGIAQHNLTVVGIDAAYVKPITTHHIMITPGQAMDVLVTANRGTGSYYMAASPYSPGVVPFDNSVTTAIFEYSSSLNTSSAPTLPDLPVYNDTAAATNFTSRFRSLPTSDHTVDVPQNITSEILITVSVNLLPCANKGTCAGPNGTRFSASLNNISFVTPTNAVLNAYYQGIPNVFKPIFPRHPPRYFNFTANSSAPDIVIPSLDTSVRMIPYNESVELVWQGTGVASSPDSHPMHLHGFSFYVVGIGTGNFAGASDRASFNLIDPPLLNTVSVPAGGWLAMRFVANNPGVWFMHCHIEKHTSWGMATVFIVQDGQTPEARMRPPPQGLPPC